MKVKCEKCIHCIGVFRHDHSCIKKKIVCELNKESKEHNEFRKGNYWGMDRPKYCPYFTVGKGVIGGR